MPRGPLPDENARRRHKRTIPTTSLPLSGRTGPAPDPPAWVVLGETGRSWWDWAWSTPQAVGWGVGAGQEVVVARRASLEDDLAVMAEVESLDLLDVLDEEIAAKFREVIQRLASLAVGRLPILKEMRELDTRLGLTPHALAALRWKIVEDESQTSGESDEVTQRRVERKARLASSG